MALLQWSAKSAFDRIVNKFNEIAGAEQGVVVEGVTETQTLGDSPNKIRRYMILVLASATQTLANGTNFCVHLFGGMLGT